MVMSSFLFKYSPQTISLYCVWLITIGFFVCLFYSILNSQSVRPTVIHFSHSVSELKLLSSDYVTQA